VIASPGRVVAAPRSRLLSLRSCPVCQMSEPTPVPPT
jgi:hypothetical protein